MCTTMKSPWGTIILISVVCFLDVISAAQDEWKPAIPYYGDKSNMAEEEYAKLIWEAVAKAHYEYPGYDGWYNNRAHPEWGGADMPMLRRLPAAYKDGVYEPSGHNRPNPIEISQATMSGPTGRGSVRRRTAFLVFFGQQVVEEILDAQRAGCPPEYFNITIPHIGHQPYWEGGHPSNPKNESGGNFMPFVRSRYDMGSTGYSPNNPREQLNEITPYIDGGLMYGVGKAWADALRSFKAGKLASTLDSKEDRAKYGDKDFPAVNRIRLPLANPPPPRDHYIKNVNRFWKLGNPRGNENPFLLTFGVFWYRWHNRVAGRISDLLWESYETLKGDPLLEGEHYATREEFDEHFDEKIFNEARKWVIATHQKIVVYDWVPSWLGTHANGSVFHLPKYNGYNQNVHPQIMHVFQSAAMRFGHTLVPPGVYRRETSTDGIEPNCNLINNTDITGDPGKQALRTCNVYWNSQEPIAEYDIDNLILGMSSQRTEKEDAIITPDLRGFVFGGLDFSRRDLMAVNIQRGRDHGLPDYNTARRIFNLKEIEEWSEIHPDCNSTELDDETNVNCDFIRGLRTVYNGSLADVDIWPAGIAETTANGPGELFQAIIADQFTRIRDGDRFWYENFKFNELFTAEQVRKINVTSLRSIILTVTNINDYELAENPFFILDTEEKCTRTLGRLIQEFDLNGTQQDDLTTRVGCDSDTTCEKIVNVTTDLLSDYEDLEYELSKYLDCNVKTSLKPDPCYGKFGPVDGSNETVVKPCTELRHYDYFSGSEVSYILTFLGVGVFAVGTVMFMILCAKRRQDSIADARRGKRDEEKRKSNDISLFSVVEWQGVKEGERNVKVRLDIAKHAIQVFAGSSTRSPTRSIDCRADDKIYLKEVNGKKTAPSQALLIRLPREYDLILCFDGFEDFTVFGRAFDEFKAALNLRVTRTQLPYIEMLKEAVTKRVRQKILDRFFRVIFQHAFRIQESERERLDDSQTQQIINCELTINEFAESLSLRPDSVFVKNMFELVDKSGNGLVSFREFLDMITIFAKGSANDKAKLLFDMYDVRQTGRLSREEFRTMIRSLMELANQTVENEKIDGVIDSMFQSAGMTSKNEITVDDFNKLLAEHKDALQLASLQFSDQEMPVGSGEGATRSKTVINRENAPNRARKTVIKAFKGQGAVERATKRATAVNVRTKQQQRQQNEEDMSALRKYWNRFANFMEANMLQVFWLTLYTLLAVAIFVERVYYYSFEREHAALRRIAGYGVSTTRGAASGMMFTFSTLLLTMCRNLITLLRETFLHQFIPFDSMISFHKIVAYYALFFTGVHIIGHAFNFYHISTQTPGDVACLFRNFYRSTHLLPNFHYWCWGTITGITGVVLTLIIIVMFVFAQQYARRNLFKAFWWTHQLHYAVWILMILHGAGILVQAPLFWTFLVAPATLWAIDQLISLSRNKVEISVIKAELLPSDVTGLTFKRPTGFEYRSGQWVRIACLELGESEYHPFTLTSAPHEDHLSLHIRALGPWTNNLRQVYNKTNTRNDPYPKLFLDGPFGEGHQDWWKYDVSVLVGGGIGVTPFASILKDIANRSSIGAKVACKKVYFLWVARSQKQYEWLVDIIKEVEEKDTKDFVSTHIFITQFFKKFDLRTTMLYICERHFQKVSDKSLFTGLRSITHFGRPDFPTFLNSLQDEHPGVSKIGVFSCGHPAMTHNVDDACKGMNKDKTVNSAFFIHHFENF